MGSSNQKVNMLMRITACLLLFQLHLSLPKSVLKVKVSLCTPRRRIGGVGVLFHSFLTSELDGGDWSALCPYRFQPQKELAVLTQWKAGWTGLDLGEGGGNLPLPRLEPKIFQSAEQSLYRTPDTGPHGELHESRGSMEDALFLYLQIILSAVYFQNWVTNRYFNVFGTKLQF